MTVPTNVAAQNGHANGPSRTTGEDPLRAIIGDRKPSRLRTALLLKPLKDRRSRRKIKELLENAKAVGEITVPLIVYFDTAAQQYRVADGETRRQVALLLCFEDVPVYVIDEPQDENELARIQVVPNTAQNRMLPVDLAREVMEAKERNPGWSQTKIGKLFGIEQGTVSKYLAISELVALLPEEAAELTYTTLSVLAELRCQPEAVNDLVRQNLSSPMSNAELSRKVQERLGNTVPVKTVPFKVPVDYPAAIAATTALLEKLKKGQKDGAKFEDLI